MRVLLPLSFVFLLQLLVYYYNQECVVHTCGVKKDGSIALSVCPLVIKYNDSRQRRLDNWVHQQLQLQSSISSSGNAVLYSPNTYGGLGNTLRGYISAAYMALLNNAPLFGC